MLYKIVFVNSLSALKDKSKSKKIHKLLCEYVPGPRGGQTFCQLRKLRKEVCKPTKRAQQNVNELKAAPLVV